MSGSPVTTSRDTVYFRKKSWAENPACFSFDSVRIRLKKNPEIFRTPDQAVCPGSSVVLGPGGPETEGYSYQWEPAENLSQDTAQTVTFLTQSGRMPDQGYG
jgi:hypothetical protein